MNNAPVLLDYQLQLVGFEGPLDVLLRLIEEHKLEITTLSLVAVTDSFVAYVDQLVEPPQALLAEFVGVAARMLVLKSRALIPQAPTEEVEEEFVDIARQLEAYRRVRAIGSELRHREAGQVRSFGRVSPPLRRFVNTRLVVPHVANLRSSFEHVIARPAQQPVLASINGHVSIQEMIERVQRRLFSRQRAISFAEAVGDTERGTIVAGFVAVLTLWARRAVELSQAGLFEEIHIGVRQLGERGGGE
jgi:segregation and condensation protein A